MHYLRNRFHGSSYEPQYYGAEHYEDCVPIFTKRARRVSSLQRFLVRLIVAMTLLAAAFFFVTLGLHPQAPQEPLSPKGAAIVEACHKVPSPGKDLCAMWVSEVYAEALGVYPQGNANDMYERLTSTERSELEPGMAVAVSTHPHTKAGQTYGHIGIYLGDNRIMDNVGALREMDLNEWIDYYGASVPVRWGWLD